MTGVSVAIGLVGPIIVIVGRIIELADTAQRNREKCKLLRDHVGMIRRLLQELDKHMRSEVWTKDLLEDLNDALSQGKALVESCQEKRSWSLVFKTQKKAKKFDALDHRISRILSQFHIVNMILIARMTNGRFFENVLQKLLDNGACMQLPQDVKEELNSSIMRLTNTVNVSSDAQAQSWLDRIKRDITYRPAAATSGWSGAQRGKVASSSGDHLMVNILNETEEIMVQAWKHNRDDEIKRLVRLLEQLTKIVQHLQTSELSLETNTRQTLVDLKQDLEWISRDIHFYNGKEHNKVKMVRFCGQGRSSSSTTSDEVLKDAYKIEYYNQVLLLALSNAK